uniref:N/A n=1 Tax=Ganoderma boninense TaxID=34458 RepID=A0A5K1K823_9APHY|nr:N/A [Ganoderma boninense]
MNPTEAFSFIESHKEKCASPTCSRTNLAKACTRRLCSKCCRALSTPCGYAKHQEKRSAQDAAHLSAAVDRYAPPTLARPPPIRVPWDPQFLVSPPAIEGAQGDAVDVRSFEKPMYETFRSLWDRRLVERQADAKAEQQRRDNQAALAHAIDLIYWREDHAPPERHTIQGIKTWPTFVVQQSPSACTFLGLSGDSPGHLEVYSLPGLYWQSRNICDVFSVSKNALLLFRRPGVSSCWGLDDAINEARDRLRSPSSVLSPIQVTVVHSSKPARSLNKRPREESDPGSCDARRSSVRRLTLAHSSPFAASVSPSPSSPSTMPGVTTYVQDITTHRTPPSLPGYTSDSSIPTSPPASSSPNSNRSISPVGLGFLDLSSAAASTLPLTGSLPSPHSSLLPPMPTNASANEAPLSMGSPMLAVADSADRTSLEPTSPLNADSLSTISPINLALDTAPDLGPIHISPMAITQWPKGMYACDVARGFQLMASSKHPNLKARFQAVFRGVEFKSNTVYRHYSAWRGSTEDERQRLLALPRTPEGLYKPGKELSGWMKV